MKQFLSSTHFYTSSLNTNNFSLKFSAKADYTKIHIHTKIHFYKVVNLLAVFN